VSFQNLIQWLEDNPHLQSLKLCSRSLSDCNARDLEKVGRLVVALKELREVDISNNNLSAPKCSAFLAELADKETTMELIMPNNTMDSSSTRILGGILRDCSNISKLNLSLDSGEAAIVLFDSLRKNAVLEDLSIKLSGTFDKTVGISLEKMLECNGTITCFREYSQSLDEDCLVLISRGLEKNNAVTAFWLTMGACGLAGYEALCRAIASTSVIKSLSVYHRNCIITRAMARQISLGLERNRSLQPKLLHRVLRWV
jgi:hypothetical protein